MIPQVVYSEETTDYAYGPDNYCLYRHFGRNEWRVSASLSNEKLAIKVINKRNGMLDSTPIDKGNKYHMTIVGLDGISTTVDIYRVIDAYKVTDPALQHAIKKLLLAGNRGHKDYLTDLREAMNSVNQAIILEEQKNAKSFKKTI